MNPQSYLNARVLKINVGFIAAEGPGFSREIPLNFADPIRVTPDFTVDNLQGVLRLTRTSEGLLVQGHLQGQMPDECSRCLDEISTHFMLDLEEIFQIVNHHVEDPYVIGDDRMLDLAPIVREEAILNTPQQSLCRPDCKGLCPSCGQNWNEETCDCAADAIDPRWSVLSDLQKQLSNKDKS